MTPQDLIIALHTATVVESTPDYLVIRVALRGGGELPPIDNPPFESLPEDGSFSLAPPETPEEKAMNVREWFETVFWPLYPRKASKAVARASAIRKAKEPQVRADIIAGLKRQIPLWEERGQPEYIPYPATWLNQERWTDVVEGNGTRPKTKQEVVLRDFKKRHGLTDE